MSTPKTTVGVRELTIRGIVIGGIITLIFTAANVYLGLKVGLTFATSIPAAVISMAILRFFANHSVVENNIVQTIASAAGTLSAIIFVLPGLVIVGWWNGFPYWTTAFLCAIGGILGVMYSIPLRRALVTGSDLPYPEGVAAAEVLKVGDTQSGAADNRRGLNTIILGALVSAGYSLLNALKVLSSTVSGALRVGSGGSMFGVGMSFALIGVGHLVGLTVGVAMTIGMVLSYGVLLPIMSSGKVADGESLADSVAAVFSQDVRFIGAGTIAVAAVWTFLKIIGPIVGGMKEALASTRLRRLGQAVDKTEQDLPVTVVIGVIVVLMVPIAVLLWRFLAGTDLVHHTGALVTVGVLYAFIMGLAIASVCGYMAGLIGASNSPISGVGILVAITAALIVGMVSSTSTGSTTTLVAFTLFTTAVVFGIATISNDNLQDLKTGQLVGATPWKQQVALVIGVVFGSLIIPPVLSLMNTAFGFHGAPGAGKEALAAPQASLISSLVKGVLGGDMRWDLLGYGVLIGVIVIIIDEVLTRVNTSVSLALPPLAVGMGIYLPMDVTILIPIGAVLGVLYNRWARTTKRPEATKRLGILLSTGLIVGESLFGVVFAGIVAASGSESPLAITPQAWSGFAVPLGVIVFVLGTAGIYRVTQRLASR